MDFCVLMCRYETTHSLKYHSSYFLQTFSLPLANQEESGPDSGR